MGSEAARLGALRRVEIDTHRHGRLNPGHDPGDIVEIHVAAGAQGMENLLQPRGAALGEGRDDHIRVPRAVGTDRSPDPRAPTNILPPSSPNLDSEAGAPGVL